MHSHRPTLKWLYPQCYLGKEVLITENSHLYVGLEGPDGCGKTTVACRIAEVTGIKTFHRRSPAFGKHGYTPAASLGMEWSVLEMCKKFGLSLLEERTFLGFAIYANHDEYTESIAREMTYLASQLNAVYIFLQASPQTVKQRLLHRGENIPNIDRDIQRYEQFVQNKPKLYQSLDIRAVNADRSAEDVVWNIVDIMKEKALSYAERECCPDGEY